METKTAPLPAQPLLPITLPSTLSSIKTYSSPHPLCVVIASYPKSGTTWMQNLVFELLSLAKFRRSSGTKVSLSHISDFCPFLENDKSHVHSTNSLRPNFLAAHESIDATVFNTHLYLDAMPAPSPVVKYIYMTRTARDVCNSFFHHLSHQALEDGGFAGGRTEFVRDWAAGEIAFGSWGAHLNSWLDDAGEPRHPACLKVEYEDMKKDLACTVRAVGGHIGVADLTDSELEDLLPRLSLEHMKKAIDKFEPRSVAWINKGDGFSFVRSGNVGDGEKEFGESDEVLFKAGFEKFPPPTGCAHLALCRNSAS